MQHVLVHIDKGLGPIGAWSYTDGLLIHFYPDSLDPHIAARARQLMAARNPIVDIPEWFAYLAEHIEYPLDDYETIDLELPLTASTVLAEFRRSWINAEPS